MAPIFADGPRVRAISLRLSNAWKQTIAQYKYWHLKLNPPTGRTKVYFFRFNYFSTCALDKKSAYFILLTSAKENKQGRVSFLMKTGGKP